MMSPTLGGLPSRQQVDDFHEMLDCVRAIGVSLDCADTTLQQSRQQVVRCIEENDKSTDGNKQRWTDGLPDSYTDALAVFTNTGDSELALDRLTIRRKIESELTRVVRSAWIYLAWMFLLAGLGIAVFALFSLPAIESMRADMNLFPQHRNLGMSPWTTHAWSIVAALVGLSVVLMIAATATGFPAWSVGWFGGKHYRDLRLQVIQADVSRSLVPQPVRSVRSARSNTEPTTLAAGNEAKPDRLNELFQRDFVRTQASAQLSRLGVLVPMVLIAVVGGLGVMAYCWMLFSPLIALIYDLSATAVSQGWIDGGTPR